MNMHIGHVALQVSDGQLSCEHAVGTLGLRVSGRGPETMFLSANEKHHELQLIESGRPGLDHVGLEVESEQDLDKLRDRVIVAGARMVAEQPLEDGLHQALRFEGPGGMTYEVYVNMEREELALEHVMRPLAQRLGHLTFVTDEKPEIERFIREVLGFRVSDTDGDRVVWMRCDADHHGLAVVAAPSGGTRLHHYAFELESWASMSHYADHVARSGQCFLWGPGRHGPGFNQFTYLPDPGGAVVEVYSDLLRIDNDAAYRPIDWSGEPRALNLWGPLMPDGWDDLGVPVVHSLVPGAVADGA